MKLKKICSLLMSALITGSVLANSIPVRAAPTGVGLSDNGQYVKITTQGIAASSGTKYRTVGWNVNHGSDKMRINLDGSDTSVEDLGNGAARFTLPLAGSSDNSIYSKMGGYGSSELVNFFYNGGTLYFNAVMTVTENGNSTGEIYTTQDGIANARNWAGDWHQFDSYFNQQLTFPAQAVKYPLNVAYQFLDKDGNRVGPPVDRLYPMVLLEKNKQVRPIDKFSDLTFTAKDYSSQGYEFAYSAFSPDGGVGHDVMKSSDTSRTFDFICPSSNIVDSKGAFTNNQKYMIFYYKPKDKPTPIPDPNRATLTVVADGDGTVTGGGAKDLVDGKATFDGITEKPNAGAKFKGWTVEYGDNVTPDNTGRVTITKDTKLIAHFTGKHTLTVKSSKGGGAGDSCQLNAGESRTLWEKATNGYKFNGWTLDCTDVKMNGNTIIMPDHDVTVTANFITYSKMVNLTVASSPSNAGTVTGGGNKTLVDGKATFNGITQKPNPGYEFKGWKTTYGDNVAPDTAGNITITQDTRLIANYQPVSIPDTKTIYGDESSHLYINASVDRTPIPYFSCRTLKNVLACVIIILVIR